MTKLACEYIDHELSNYELGVQKYIVDDPKSRQIVLGKDQDARNALDTKEVTEPVEKFVAA